MLVQFRDEYLNGLESLKNEILSYNNDGDLFKVHGDIINPAGNLCLHLCGNLQHYLGATLGNTGYKRNRDTEFSRKDFTKSILLDEIEKARDSINITFKKLNESDLNNLYPENPHWKKASIGYVLVICLSHLNYHLGQINYLRRMNP
jgi:hypothetical protein